MNQPNPTELEFLNAVIAECRQRPIVQFEVATPAVLSICAGLQIALRHPGLPDRTKDVLNGFLSGLQSMMPPAIRELIQRGFDPANDIPPL